MEARPWNPADPIGVSSAPPWWGAPYIDPATGRELTIGRFVRFFAGRAERARRSRARRKER